MSHDSEHWANHMSMGQVQVLSMAFGIYFVDYPKHAFGMFPYSFYYQS